jgi:hypothetical protein
LTLLDQRPTDSEAQQAEALFREARRRRRRRQLRFGISALLVLSGAVALLLWSRGAPTKSASPHVRRPLTRPSTAKTATDGVHPVQPGPLALSSNGDLYVADDSRNEILERLSSGAFRVIAGNGKVGFSGDGGPAVEAELDDPQGIVADPSGTVYFADSGNSRVRSILPNGTITTVVGNGQDPTTPDLGASAAGSAIGHTYAVALGTDGSLFVAVSDAVLQLDPFGRLTIVADEQSFEGFDPSEPLNNQCDPASLAVDGAGNLYLGCTDPFVLVERTPEGGLYVVAQVRPHDANAALAMAPDGGVFAVDGDSIIHYSQAGRRTVTDYLAYRLPGGSFFWPQGIAVGPGGSLYLDQDGVSGIGPPAIVKYWPVGTNSVLWQQATSSERRVRPTPVRGSAGTG